MARWLSRTGDLKALAWNKWILLLTWLLMKMKMFFVVDRNNDRILLLSPTLAYMRKIVSREQLQWRPYRLSIDVRRRRLYVAVNEHKGGKWVAGRVIVASV